MLLMLVQVVHQAAVLAVFHSSAILFPLAEAVAQELVALVLRGVLEAAEQVMVIQQEVLEILLLHQVLLILMLCKVLLVAVQLARMVAEVVVLQQLELMLQLLLAEQAEPVKHQLFLVRQ
jgi:hypothetical protein